MDKGSKSQAYNNLYLWGGYNEPARKYSIPEGFFLSSGYNEPTGKHSIPWDYNESTGL